MTRRNIMKKNHKKGCGNIFSKKDGTLYCRWTINGHTFTKCAHTKSLRIAEKLLQELTQASRKERDNELLAMKYVKMAKTLRGESSSFIKIENAFGSYLASPTIKEISESTIPGYKSNFNTFVKFAKANGVRYLDDVNENIATSFAKFLTSKQGVSNNTYNKVFTLLSKIFRTLLPKNHNPFSQIAMKQVEKNSRRELTPDEVHSILDETKGTEYHTLITIGLFTGLRLGDCANLKWSAIDLTINLLTLIPHKTQNSSSAIVNIPIHPILHQTLLEIPRSESPYVLPTIHNLYEVSPSRLSKNISSIFEKVGIETNHKVNGNKNKSPLATFHSIRHTFTSAILNSNKNIPVGVAQSLLGHSNASMTLHYTHTNIESLKNAVNAIAL